MASKNAKFLKSKGLIPNWDLRKPLTSGQKSWLTKIEKEFKHLIQKPQDFVIRKVSKKTAEHLKNADYKVVRGRAIISTQGGTVHIKRGSVTFGTPHETRKVIIGTKEYLLHKSSTLFDKDLKPGQWWAGQIGDRPHFRHLHKDLREFTAYLSTVQWKKPDAEQHLRIVLITIHDPQNSLFDK